MRNISFSLTTAQFVAGTKTVTRRLGWKAVKAGDELCVVEKAQGLKRGETVKRLGTIRVTNVWQEALSLMVNDAAYGVAECRKEGFPDLAPAEFVMMFCNYNGCEMGETVTRIEFEKL